MLDVHRGSEVVVRTVDNRLVRRRAVTGVVQGDDFPVVWVCREEEYRAAQAQGREPEAIPWPAGDVTTDMADT